MLTTIATLNYVLFESVFFHLSRSCYKRRHDITFFINNQELNVVYKCFHKISIAVLRQQASKLVVHSQTLKKIADCWKRTFGATKLFIHKKHCLLRALWANVFFICNISIRKPYFVKMIVRRQNIMKMLNWEVNSFSV